MKYPKIILLCLAISFTACVGVNGTLSSNAVGETECIENLLDGDIRLRAWGSGLNKLDAIQMAQKKAVRDILFKGIGTGKSDCLPYPIFPSPNTLEKNTAYFEAFLKSDGEYKKYVQVEKVLEVYRIVGGRQLATKIQIRVSLSTLRKDMQKLPLDR